MQSPRNLSVELLSGFRTILISTNMQYRWSFHNVTRQIFRDNGFPLQYFMNQNPWDGICWFEVENTRDEPNGRDPVPGTLSHRYQKLYLGGDQTLDLPDLYRAGQLGLRILSPRSGVNFNMPRMNALSSLVELDSTECHLVYSPMSWWSLISTTPAVEAVALPVFSLHFMGDYPRILYRS